MGRFQTSRLISASVDEVFSHITDLGHLPDWLEGEIGVLAPETLPDSKTLRDRREFEVQLSRWGVSVLVQARVEEFVPDAKFSYRQISGFFQTWAHSQVLQAHAPQLTLLTDIVDFRLPFGLVGAVFDDLLICRDIERILNRRLERIEEHFRGRAS